MEFIILKDAEQRAIEKASNHLKPPQHGFRLDPLCPRSLRRSSSHQHMTQAMFGNLYTPIERFQNIDLGTLASPELIQLWHDLMT
jgi:hypothetical protein